MPGYVAILEDETSRISSMLACVKDLLPEQTPIFFDDAFVMIGWLEKHLPEVVLISLDHDLPIHPDHGTGRNVADYLGAREPTCPVIVHTSNGYFAPGMLSVLKEGNWPNERVYPHGDRDWIIQGWADQIRMFIQSGWIFNHSA